MSKRLAVIPELCSGCRICELTCAIEHFGVNNPKKSAIRVLITYPHPVVRMPIVCSQCKVPACADACPFGVIKVSPEGEVFKCDLCDGRPVCVKNCTRQALAYVEPLGAYVDRAIASAGRSEGAV